MWATVVAALWSLVASIPLTLRLGALVVGVGCSALSVIERAPGRRRTLVLVCSIAMSGLLVTTVAVTAPPLPFRVALVAIFLGYVLGLIAWLLAARRSVDSGRTIAVGAIVVAPLLVGEMVLGEQQQATRSVAAENEGRMRAPQPGPNGRYSPTSNTIAVYPDNPRGYFVSDSASGASWRLRVDSGPGAAALEVLPEENLVRIRIDSAGGIDPWRIQAVRPGWMLRQGGTYRLSLRVRAMARRGVGLSLSSDPLTYGDVGFPARRLVVDSAWVRVEDVFTATRTVDSAYLLVDLGDHTATTELTHVAVTDLRSGMRAERTSGAHTVSFRFNQEGCRGPALPESRSAATARILALGDAYTLGAGVHEADTYAARLEDLLNSGERAAGGSRTFEVWNCGVSGYGTAEARVLFDSLAPKLVPDAVLLAVTPGDDSVRTDDVLRAATWSGGGFKGLLLSPGWLGRKLRSRPPLPSIHGMLSELTALEAATRTRGIPLVVVFFQHRRNPEWAELHARLADSLTALSVPTLSLEPILRAFHDTALVVHPLLDAHPNEVAHRTAADAIYRFLRDREILHQVGAARDSTPVARSRGSR